MDAIKATVFAFILGFCILLHVVIGRTVFRNNYSTIQDGSSDNLDDCIW
jgi:hypothetical protein